MFADWKAGDLAIRDLVTGDVKGLGLRTLPAPAEESFEMGLYPPDQKQLALTHFLPDGVSSFDVISTQLGAKRRSLIKRQDRTDVHPLAWSADGKSILTVTWGWVSAAPPRVLDSRIAWVSGADGTMTTVKALETNEVGTINLSPDGRYIAYDASLQIPPGTFPPYQRTGETKPLSCQVRTSTIPRLDSDGRHLVFVSNQSRNYGRYAVAVQDGESRARRNCLRGKRAIGVIWFCPVRRARRPPT